MYIERSDDRITLHFEISPNQQAMTVLYGLVTAGFVARLRKATGLPGSNSD